jgi:hypothetical protein
MNLILVVLIFALLLFALYKAIKNKKEELELEKENEKDRLRRINEELRRSRENLSNMVEALQSVLDKDKNGQVDLIETNLLMDTVKKNQSEIQKINPEYFHKFVKIDSHLAKQRLFIQHIYSTLLSGINNNPTKESKGVSEYDETMLSIVQGKTKNFENSSDFLLAELTGYSSVQYTALHMVNALLTEDMITFYQIYEAFDKLEIWDSHYQQMSMAELKNTNRNLEQLIKLTEDFSNQILHEIGGLAQRMTEQNAKLENICSAVQAGNMLMAVNTYQLHGISKNTEQIRKSIKSLGK